MEVKKSKKAEIESKRGTWLLVGFLTVLAAMFVTFEWSRKDVKVNTLGYDHDAIFVEELVPITFPDKPEPPPLPQTEIIETITLIDNETDMPETEVTIKEFNANEAITVRHIVVEPEVVEEVDEVVDFADIMPEYPGGAAALMAYLGKSIKYPIRPQEDGVQGKVIVQFVVDKDGSISNPTVAKSVHPDLDREALRVIQSMPKWKPGVVKGRTVRVKYTVPVTFKLQYR